MPRYKGATKYEREQYGRMHYDFMSAKYGSYVEHTFQGETTRIFTKQDNPSLWAEERAVEYSNSSKGTYWHQDFPTPYCGHRMPEMRWFLEILRSWPMDIKDTLSSELYGDACDREYVRGLMRLLEINNYFDDGAAIIIPAGDNMFMPLPSPENGGKWDVGDIIAKHGSTNYYECNSKNRIRAEFAIEWLRDKEDAEARGQKMYDELYFYDDTNGDILQSEDKGIDTAIKYGSAGDESDCDAIFTKLGWITAANKPQADRIISPAAFRGAVEALIYYSYLEGGGSAEKLTKQLGEKYGFSFASTQRVKLQRGSDGDFPQDYYTAAADTEVKIEEGNRGRISGGIFKAGGEWWNRQKSSAKSFGAGKR
ncbi:hypothetical protein [Hymenobacter sediminicola]|uniref:Uncharacterized protein n=1 Tax=Hymenobacter sediminicola TaxID=2761579 RepID=A0A7G7W780_9BACT|nr:hypothetical protein [Hymenobacter sediminicola]QNH62223.1 hypothetical protein H4317_19140 [Hymenobacter sediminicola]